MLLIQTTDIVTFLWLSCLMFYMGTSVTMGQLSAALKKGAIIWKGLFTNLLLVPVVAFGLLLLFKPDPMIAAGFLTAVVFSGAPMGPPFTTLSKGDVPLSIGLMVILAALTTVISPAVLKLLLAAGLTQGTTIEVNYLKIMSVVILGQLLPLSLGLALNHWRSAIVQKIAKPVQTLNKILLLGTCFLVILTHYKTLQLFGWGTLVGCLTLFAACLIIGWMLGGPNQAERKALIFSTTIRNTPASLVVASTNFAGTAAPAAVFVFTLVSVLGTFAVAFFMGRKS